MGKREAVPAALRKARGKMRVLQGEVIRWRPSPSAKSVGIVD